jgi:hypothetical protein
VIDLNPYILAEDRVVEPQICFLDVICHAI